MMLFIILPSMLMVVLSGLSLMKHLICGNNKSWLSNLNPTYETLDWSRKWLANFIVGKTQLVSFDRFSNSVTNDVIIDRYVLEEKSFKMLGMFFFLNWIRALTLSLLLRLLPKKLDTRQKQSTKIKKYQTYRGMCILLSLWGLSLLTNYCLPNSLMKSNIQLTFGLFSLICSCSSDIF